MSGRVADCPAGALHEEATALVLVRELETNQCVGGARLITPSDAGVYSVIQLAA